MSEQCNHAWFSGPFCVLCGQPADEPCPSSCGVDETLHCGCRKDEPHKATCPTIFGSMMSHPKAQEPAVSEAAYRAHWGNDSPVVSERERMHRVEVEMTFQGTGCVLRTRDEWNALHDYTLQAQQHAIETGNIATGELLEGDRLRAELTTLRDKYGRVVDQLMDLRQGDMEAELATLRAQLAEKEAELERLRKEVMPNAATVRSEQDIHNRARSLRDSTDAVTGAAHRQNAGLLTLPSSDHRLGSGPGERDTTYTEPRPVIRTRPML